MRFAVFSPARCLMSPSLAAPRTDTAVRSGPSPVRLRVIRTGFMFPSPPPTIALTTRAPARWAPSTSSMRPARARIPSACVVAASTGMASARSVSYTFFFKRFAANIAPRRPPDPLPLAPSAPSAAVRISSSSSITTAAYWPETSAGRPPGVAGPALTTGCTWRQLPPVFGPSGPTAHRRFTERSRARVRGKLHRMVLDELGARGILDWSRCAIDSVEMRQHPMFVA